MSRTTLAAPALRRRMRMASVLVLSTTLLSGCNFMNRMMFKPTGDVMQLFAAEHTVPWMLESDDVVVGCTMSEAMSPMLLSFGRVTTPPDQLAVMMYLSAGGCEEARALEYELQSIRALRARLPDEAQDAQIVQKRHLELASRRQFKGWQHLQKFYGEPGNGECPKFADDFSEFIYMVGLLSGLQSLNNELQSTMPVGVPKNIASKVERAAGCLNDDKWWGVPMGLRAVVWSTLPGAEPAGENASQRLDAAMKKGEKSRVRVADVLAAIAAINKGDTERVKKIIRRHADQVAKKPSDPTKAMIDKIASMQLLAISDRMWTENTGHRTPVGGFGSFWDDKRTNTAETVDLDDLL